MNLNDKALLIGLVLGDGHITKRESMLEITHSYKQKFYLDYKVELLKRLLHRDYISVYHRVDARHNEYKLSVASKYYKLLRKWIYPNGIKYYSKQLLDYLIPEAIALWWMDDGSMGRDISKVSGKVTCYRFHFYIYTSKEETDNIIEMFKIKYDINFYPVKRIDSKGNLTFMLKCATKEGKKFSDLIRPYILPEFSYKIMPDL